MRILSLIVLCGLFLSQAYGAASSSEAHNNNEPEEQARKAAQDALDLTNRTVKPEDYYLRLLQFQDEHRTYYDQFPHQLKIAITEAENILVDNDTKELYEQLGHQTFLDLHTMEVLDYFAQIPSATDRLLKTAEFYQRILDQDNREQALDETRKSGIIIHHSREEVPLDDQNDQDLYNALGPWLFEKLKEENEKYNQLKQYVDNQQPSNENVIKKRIAQLQDSLRARALQKKEVQKKKGKEEAQKEEPEADKEAEIKKEEKLPQPKDTSIEAFKKANQKLQTAQYSLQTVRTYLRGISAKERTAVKKQISTYLSDYKRLRSMSNQIKAQGGGAHGERKKFSNLVDSIWSLGSKI